MNLNSKIIWNGARFQWFFCFVTGALMYLNEGTLLNNCRLRYARKQIYVSVFYLILLIS